jgi:hypothetical protein
MNTSRPKPQYMNITLSRPDTFYDDVSPPYPHRIPTLDNIVIYGGDTVGIRRDYGQAPYVMELMLVAA